MGWKLLSVKTGVQYNTLLITRWSPSGLNIIVW